MAQVAVVSAVLIVEDEVFTREMAKMLVEEWGFIAHSASDADEAFTVLRSTEPINVLFTDIYLKRQVLGGLDVAREAVRRWPDVRVLYTTGNAASETLREQFVPGAGFIPKPYSPEQLKAALDGLIAQ
jgi:CheY-like chemotaxis protein